MVVADNSVNVMRNDKLVTGSFHPSGGSNYVGDLHWRNGQVTKDMTLTPNADCSEVRTNQSWWYLKMSKMRKPALP